MDTIKNESITKVKLECKEIENDKKSIESPQENNKKTAEEKKKNEESRKQEADASDDEDDLANVIADLYMSGSSNFPNNAKEQEKEKQVVPTSSGVNQMFDEEIPEVDVDEETLIDRLLEELNHCVVGIILEDEIPNM